MLVRFFCVCDRLATAQVIIFRLREMVLVEKGYGHIAGEWVGRQKDSRNKEQQKEEKQRKNFSGKINLAPESQRQEVNLFHQAWDHNGQLTDCYSTHDETAAGYKECTFMGRYQRQTHDHSACLLASPPPPPLSLRLSLSLSLSPAPTFSPSLSHLSLWLIHLSLSHSMREGLIHTHMPYLSISLMISSFSSSFSFSRSLKYTRTHAHTRARAYIHSLTHTDTHRRTHTHTHTE